MEIKPGDKFRVVRKKKEGDGRAVCGHSFKIGEIITCGNHHSNIGEGSGHYTNGFYRQIVYDSDLEPECELEAYVEELKQKGIIK